MDLQAIVTIAASIVVILGAFGAIMRWALKGVVRDEVRAVRDEVHSLDVRLARVEEKIQAVDVRLERVEAALEVR